MPESVSQAGVDPLQVLDLTEAEESVVNSLLEKGPLSVSAIGRVADIPRTTAYSVLLRLRERGLVRRKSHGYNSVWERVSPKKLQKRLSNSLDYFDRNVTEKQLQADLGVQIEKDAEFSIFRGAERMLQVYQWLILNHRNERVCGIRPRLSMEAIFRKLDSKKMVQLNNAVKDNKVIFDTILSDNIQQYYREILLDHPEVARSIEDCTTSVHVVADSFLSFSTDLIIGQDVALLANWDEEVLVLIKNADMVTFLQCLFEVLRDSGTIYDLSKLVRGIIAGEK